MPGREVLFTIDRLGQRLRGYDTAWTLDLADPYRWLEPAALDPLQVQATTPP